MAWKPGRKTGLAALVLAAVAGLATAAVKLKVPSRVRDLVRRGDES